MGNLTLSEWYIEYEVFSAVGQLLVFFVKEFIVEGALLDFQVSAEEVVVHDLVHVVVLLEIQGTVKLGQRQQNA